MNKTFPPDFHLDLMEPGFIQDPYPVYARLRAESPVFYDPGLELVFFTRHADISALLKDRRLGRDYAGAPRQSNPGPFARMHEHSLMEMEPPDHTRLRSLVNKVFTPARVEGLRGRIQAVTDTLLDAVEARGKMDLLADFAEPLPVTVIAELLGVPEGGRALLRPWSRDIVQMYEVAPTSEHAQRADQAVSDFSAYVGELAARRRKDPAGDLITALALVGSGDEGGSRLSEEELTATVILLLNAGHEATVNAIANGMLALFRDPQAMALLSQEAPRLMRSAADELLRFDTPLQLFKRWVLGDLDFNGTVLRAGQQVALLYGSGNRDERRFLNADRLVLDRKDNPHQTFGAGIHYCLGAPLARVEMQIAIETLLRRFPNIRPVDEPLEYRPTYVIRGLKHLQVEFR